MLLDSPVEPPVLGVGLLNGVMARLVGLDRHDLLDEVGDALKQVIHQVIHGQFIKEHWQSMDI